jgi:hypothetical protein
VRHDRTPLLVLGAGALALVALTAGTSTGRRAARRVGDAVTELVNDWIPTLLKKTSQHEGTFWSVQKNLDGNGVSYGILQWTQKSGSLGRLLRAMADADPAAFARIFGASWQRVLEVTARRSFDAVDGVVLWAEPWASRFAEAGRWPAFQSVQVRVASTSEYMTGAVRIAELLGVRSERAMVMYYNRTVHQGVAGATGPAERLAAWYAEDPSRRPANPNDVLAQYAWSCAGKFRRTRAPTTRNFTASGNIWWQPVIRETSAVAPGAYAVRSVPVSGVWHAATGPAAKPWSLYDLIMKRSSDILLDPTLRDADVDLHGPRLVA